MCGIVCYTGQHENENPVQVALEGLDRVEERGYDSAGLAVVAAGKIRYLKRAKNGGTEFPIQKLKRELAEDPNFFPPPLHAMIAHTRWATHGPPDDAHAHPHFSCAHETPIAVVHNGQIENDRELRRELLELGHVFASGTDTEVVPHLIAEAMKSGRSFEEAFLCALKRLEGTYALAAICAKDPTTIMGARMGSPVIIGSLPRGKYIASTSAVLVGKTNKALALEDGQVVRLRPNELKITYTNGEHARATKILVEGTVEEARKGPHPYFLIKEIKEQSDTIRRVCAGRLKPNDGLVRLGGLEERREELRITEEILALACGTSYHAAMVGQELIHALAGIPVQVEFATQFLRSRKPRRPNTTALAVTQSGESADTLGALRESRKRQYAPVLGLVNVVGTSVAREADGGVYLHAGPEIAVASTKAFTGQVVAFSLLAEWLYQLRHGTCHKDFLHGLAALPDTVERILAQEDEMRRIAERYGELRSFTFLANGILYPVALEGALKLKELCYVDAEGYPLSQYKHGGIARVDDTLLIIALVLKGDKDSWKNLKQLQARGARILAVAMEGDEAVREIAEEVFYIPEVPELLAPVPMVVPLQYLAYESCLLREEEGCHPDKPRNLAKSVTVE